jgi:hypothetical protein
MAGDEAMRGILLLLIAVATSLRGADVRVLPHEAVAAFGGSTRLIEVAAQNRTQISADLEVGWQLLQTSSAVAAPVSAVQPWKRLTLSANQVLIDEVMIPLPSVKTESRFLIRFLREKEVLGLAEIWVYPPNLLHELNDLLEGTEVFLLRTSELWKRALADADVNYVEIAHPTAIPQRARLVIFGPNTNSSMEATELETATALAKTGIAVVLLKSMSIPDAATEPSYYVLNTSDTAIVVGQSTTLTNLPADPWAQLRLLKMAKLAIRGKRHGTNPNENP